MKNYLHRRQNRQGQHIHYPYELMREKYHNQSPRDYLNRRHRRELLY